MLFEVKLFALDDNENVKPPALEPNVENTYTRRDFIIVSNEGTMKRQSHFKHSVRSDILIWIPAAPPDPSNENHEH